jgi:hypothetical protein
MGYTHSWDHSGFNTKQWSAASKRAARIIQASDVPVQFESDDPAPPEISTTEIRFNGVDCDGYETFAVERGRSSGFCKTAREPYDEIVVAILGMLADVNPEFGWTSDGDNEDHAAGAALYIKSLGDA